MSVQISSILSLVWRMKTWPSRSLSRRISSRGARSTSKVILLSLSRLRIDLTCSRLLKLSEPISQLLRSAARETTQPVIGRLKESKQLSLKITTWIRLALILTRKTDTVASPLWRALTCSQMASSKRLPCQPIHSAPPRIARNLTLARAL